MYQIDNSTTVSTIPASTTPGVPGFFTDGNPATGVSATILPAEFMNMLMMENLNVLASAGINPDKAKFNQLSLAIAKIVQNSAAGAASESTAGILKLSTTEQVASGTDDSTAVTPLKLYQKLVSYLVQATEIAFGWAKIATQTITNTGADDATIVTPKKMAGALQAQALTAFTTAGTAPAFTLTPSPAVTGLAANQRFRVKFHAAGAGSDTINISGRGAKSLRQYDATGAKIPATIASGQLADIEYDGTDVVVLDPLPTVVNNLVGLQGAAKNLAASATGTNAVVSITADEIILESSSNAYQVVRGVTLSPSLANSGAGGLDTGTSATNTWYSVWVIWNGTSASGLFSLSATAPTMPAGYTHKARIGWVRSDGTGNKYPLSFVQAGATVQYKIVGGTNVPSMPLMASGNSGDPSAPTWIAIPIAAFVPPTAAKIILTLSLPLATSAAVMVAPNPSYGAYNSSTNPPPHGLSGGGSIVPSSAQCSLALEATSIYWAANSPSARLYVGGWEDNS